MGAVHQDHVAGSQLVEGGQVDLLQRPADRTLTECVDGVSRLRIDRRQRRGNATAVVGETPPYYVGMRWAKPALTIAHAAWRAC